MTRCSFGQHLELLELGRPALERYAERHGYEIVVRGEPGRRDRLDLRRVDGWSPIFDPLLRAHAQNGVETVGRP